jgi:N-acetylglutamate synthase-like GNAT family acetyltransferase
MKHQVKFAETPEELQQIIALRYEILRKPWQQSAESASDDLEQQSYNAYLTNEQGKVVACGRLQKNSASTGQIRYMAVATSCQGKGYGKRLLSALEEKARTLGLREIELQARDNALEFYEHCGYETVTPSFKLWDIIQHYLMRRNLF